MVVCGFFESFERGLRGALGVRAFGLRSKCGAFVRVIERVIAIGTGYRKEGRVLKLLLADWRGTGGEWRYCWMELSGTI